MNKTVTPATIAELLAATRARLPNTNETTLLVAHALGLSRETLYAHPERAVSEHAAAQTMALVTRRAAGEPVAYITGEREFYGITLAVNPAVLIPRPETELVVELALTRLKNTDSPVVADVGTGSGAIALAIARERPDAFLVASDCSTNALALAAANARRLATPNVAFVCADWLTAVAAESLDLIVSNPPYVATGDPHLGASDLRFEPPQALAAGTDGLDAIRLLIAEASRRLKSSGALILEHGTDQQSAICTLLAEHGYANIETHRDLAGLPRAVAACKSSAKLA